MENNLNAAPRLSDAGTLFKASWETYLKHWQKLVVLTLIPMIIMGLGGLIAWALKIIRYVPHAESATNPNLIPVSILGFNFTFTDAITAWPLWLMAVLIVIFAIIGIIVSIAMVTSQLVILKEKDEKLGVTGALKQSTKYWVKYFIVGIVYSLIILGGLILFIIPGIWWSIMFCLASVSIVLEDKGIIEALKRSKELVKGYWWAVLGRLILFGLILLAIYLIALIPLSIILGLLRLSGYEVVAVLQNLAQLVFGPMYLAYMVLLYSELQKIKQ